MKLENFKKYLHEKAGVTDEQFAELASSLRAETLAKGAILLHQGGVCDHAFFVAEGLLRSYTIDENGKEHIIQFAPEDWLITDRSSVYFNLESELNIDCVEDSEVVFIDKNFVDKASEISLSYRSFNNTALHRHIWTLQHRVAMLLGASAEERYLEFIELYPKIPLRVPQWMIASYLGITPESLSRVRKELARRNFRPNY